ncbi:selenide, water dikinase [Oscillochloris trichoides DG-6]|uniref:Selenide, water dikinase n=1 Tax=Oscillochloris trichoides DG-6 TaxID=765420 RepID=E1IHR9_9CHLR|nr:selenide, water dikinase [Oscillochloris trichoides DG-6]
MLVGLDSSDDAAVYQLDANTAIVQTLDFFPPIVDDPYTFGAIAAANALSDVYAMGGRPITALSVAAFPDDLDPEITAAIIQGGADKVAEAGAVLAGGHTISDREPKFGLSVTGLVHPQRITTKGGARPGDLLLLTKPLGVGLITTAMKWEAGQENDLAAAIASMLLLNRTAAEFAALITLHAATDITGFGLLGHAAEMARASGVAMRFRTGDLPLLPGALGYARAGICPGGLERNRDFLAIDGYVRYAPDVEAAYQLILCDPQTSGGLFFALSPNCATQLLRHYADVGQGCWVVGEVLPGSGIEVVA